MASTSPSGLRIGPAGNDGGSSTGAGDPPSRTPAPCNTKAHSATTRVGLRVTGEIAMRQGQNMVWIRFRTRAGRMLKPRANPASRLVPDHLAEGQKGQGPLREPVRSPVVTATRSRSTLLGGTHKVRHETFHSGRRQIPREGSPARRGPAEVGLHRPAPTSPGQRFLYH